MSERISSLRSVSSASSVLEVCEVKDLFVWTSLENIEERGWTSSFREARVLVFQSQLWQ